MSDVSPIPVDIHTITPRIVVRGASEAIQFYRSAFAAKELYRTMAPDGKSIMHAELLLGDSVFFLNEEFPALGLLAPVSDVKAAVTLHLYIEQVDNVLAHSVAAGAEVILPVADRFWGDRYAMIRDPFGHRWSLASKFEDISPATVAERARLLFPTEQ